MAVTMFRQLAVFKHEHKRRTWAPGRCVACNYYCISMRHRIHAAQVSSMLASLTVPLPPPTAQQCWQRETVKGTAAVKINHEQLAPKTVPLTCQPGVRFLQNQC